MTAVLIVFLVLLILAVVYVSMIMPRATEQPDMSKVLTDYAHRGLHGKEAPENSLKAFGLACEAGFGIELDVQLSRDGEVMVFHDYSLLRMTGCDRMLSELDAAELATLSLDGTDQTIPTLRQVLELVAGRVPLLIELKGEDTNTALCAKVAALLRDYEGPFCMESFNPLLIGHMKKLFPETFCGLLYTNVCRDKKKCSLLNILLTAMALNVVAKPDFIAYNKADRGSLPVRITTGLYGAGKATWTITTAEELEISHQRGEMPIFEKIV